jgi:hypothetical protein
VILESDAALARGRVVCALDRSDIAPINFGTGITLEQSCSARRFQVP